MRFSDLEQASPRRVAHVEIMIAATHRNSRKTFQGLSTRNAREKSTTAFTKFDIRRIGLL